MANLLSAKITDMKISDLSNFTELNFNSAEQIEGQGHAFAQQFDVVELQPVEYDFEPGIKFDLPGFDPDLGCPWCISGCDIRLEVEFQALPDLKVDAPYQF